MSEHLGYSAAEQDRLVRKAMELQRRGYNYELIAAAAGVTRTYLGTILRKRGYRGARNYSRYRDGAARLPTLKPVVWRDRDVAYNPEPLYRRSTTIPLLRSIVETCTHDNAVNRFAHDTADAIRAGDQQWLSEARIVLDQARLYIHRLTAVAEVEEARRRAIEDPRERDDIGPHLRAVKD
jgi:hypothetical protein